VSDGAELPPTCRLAAAKGPDLDPEPFVSRTGRERVARGRISLDAVVDLEVVTDLVAIDRGGGDGDTEGVAAGSELAADRGSDPGREVLRAGDPVGTLAHVRGELVGDRLRDSGLVDGPVLADARVLGLCGIVTGGLFRGCRLLLDGGCALAGRRLILLLRVANAQRASGCEKYRQRAQRRRYRNPLATPRVLHSVPVFVGDETTIQDCKID